MLNNVDDLIVYVIMNNNLPKHLGYTGIYIIMFNLLQLYVCNESFIENE